MSSLPTGAIRDAVASAAAGSGMFNSPVLEHEPVSAPGNGLTAAVTADRISPAPAASGLAATSVLLLLGVRLYTRLDAEPPRRHRHQPVRRRRRTDGVLHRRVHPGRPGA